MSRYMGMNEGGLPALVHDILESNCGDWFDVERIIGEVRNLRPDAQADSIRRAIERLKARQVVEAEIRDRVNASRRGNFGRERSFIRVAWRSYWIDEGSEAWLAEEQ